MRGRIIELYNGIVDELIPFFSFYLFVAILVPRLLEINGSWRMRLVGWLYCMRFPLHHLCKKSGPLKRPTSIYRCGP